MNNTRIKWIDLTRVLAIMAVLLCHCSQGIYGQFNTELMSSVSLFSKIFAYTTFSLGRIGVPLFLMISGYLLLDRTYDNEKTMNFWSENCKHLIICTIIWCAIYQAFLIIVMHDNMNLVTIISGIIFLSELNINHIWYMPMIIGMYILIPFVSTALRQYDLKVIVKPVTFFSIIIFLCPFLIYILNLCGIHDLQVTISLGFSGGVYGIYLVLGYIIKKGYFKKIKSNHLICLFIISLVIIVLIQLYSYKYQLNFKLWYDSPFILLASITLFELISRMKEINFYDIIKLLSKYSFSVFLVHNFFRLPLIPYFAKLPFNYPIKLILLTFTVMIASYILSIAISKIPKIGKYVLYIK